MVLPFSKALEGLMKALKSLNKDLNCLIRAFRRPLSLKRLIHGLMKALTGLKTGLKGLRKAMGALKGLKRPLAKYILSWRPIAWWKDQ